MADKKISELDAITGAATAADDFFIVVDTSGSATKKISRAELNNAIEQDVLAQVDITSANIDGGTIDNTPIGATTPSTGDFTTVDTTGDVTVGGTITSDGLTVEDSSDATIQIKSTKNGTWTIGESLGSLDFFGSDTSGSGAGVKSSIQSNAGVANGAGFGLDFFTHNTSTLNKRISVDYNGDISFYDNTGVTQGLFWDASTQRLGLGTTSPGNLLEISGSSPILEINSTAGVPELQFSDGGVDEFSIQYDTGTNALRFVEGGVGAHMVIKDGGNVGIGTSSPTTALDVTGTITSDGLTVDGNIALNGITTFTDSNVRLDLMESDTTDVNSRLQSSSGSMLFRTINDSKSSATTRMEINNSTGDISFYDSTGVTQGLFWDASTQGLGLGVTTNSHTLTVDGEVRIGAGDSGTSDMVLKAATNTGISVGGSTQAAILTTNGTSVGSVHVGIEVPSNDSNDGFYIATDSDNDGVVDTLAMKINAAGNVGIGTTSGFVSSAGYSSLNINGSTSGLINIKSNGTDNLWLFSDGSNQYVDARVGGLIFRSAGSTEVMRIDTSGFVGISTTSPQNELDVRGTVEIGNGSTQRMYLQGTGDDFRFYDRANLAERMRITSGGNVGIGVSSPAHPLSVENPDGNTNTISMINNSSNLSRLAFVQNGSTTAAYSSIDADGRSTGFIRFNTNDAEAMRIDSSGNLLVGKTSSAFGTVGGEIKSNGQITGTATNAAAMQMNRKSSDGTILNFAKDGSTVGSIGTSSGFLYTGTDDVGLIFRSNESIRPYNPSTTSERDAAIDLGHSAVRFNDIYATNGTIQTSDQNEKQQIASLTDAEITAAKAISQLFKTFKWNNSVTEKGDAARRHTGVIAQDVEATWWEADGETYYNADDAPEGATEHNRKGIRYPELLSFVGAATEQRLANIETRLTALEAN